MPNLIDSLDELVDLVLQAGEDRAGVDAAAGQEIDRFPDPLRIGGQALRVERGPERLERDAELLGDLLRLLEVDADEVPFAIEDVAEPRGVVEQAVELLARVGDRFSRSSFSAFSSSIFRRRRSIARVMLSTEPMPPKKTVL